MRKRPNLCQTSGFRIKHSTETALINVIDDLLFNLEHYYVSGMTMVDYRKAFDLVDHTLLLKRLQIYGLTKESLLWFTSYMQKRRQFVKMGHKLLDTALIYRGTSQGSIPGPLLFIIFINDLPLHVTSLKIDLYADDTTLTSSMNRNWQLLIDFQLMKKKNQDHTTDHTYNGKHPMLRIDGEMSLTMNGFVVSLYPASFSAEIDHDSGSRRVRVLQRAETLVYRLFLSISQSFSDL